MRPAPFVAQCAVGVNGNLLQFSKLQAPEAKTGFMRLAVYIIGGRCFQGGKICKIMNTKLGMKVNI